MTVLRSLNPPETVETQHGVKKATHEVFCYSITPFLNPPIKVLIYKGTMDSRGHFQVLVSTQTTIEISLEEFKELLGPNSEGKPSNDFRLSDIIGILGRRYKKPQADGK